MGNLLKLVKGVTFIQGSAGQPGDPGSPAIPAGCKTVTTETLKTYLIQTSPGISPPDCVDGALLGLGWAVGATCPQPPIYTIVTSNPAEYVYSTSTVCWPYTPPVPPTPFTPPTASQTIIDYNLGWNAGANSIETLFQGAFTFGVSIGTIGAVVGLSKNIFTSGYLDITHGFHTTTGKYRIIESGVGKTGYINYTDGSVFKIEVLAESVIYYVNNVPVFTSTTPAPYGGYYLKGIMWSGNDLIIGPAVSVYGVGTGLNTMLPLISSGLGRNGTDAYSITDLPLLTSAGTGRTFSIGNNILPTLTSYSYADFEAVGYGVFSYIRSSGYGVGSGGGYGNSTIGPLTSIGYYSGYQYGIATLQQLQSLGEGGLISADFVSLNFAIFAPREGYAHGITGGVGDGTGQSLQALESIASNYSYGESFTTLQAIGGVGYDFGGGGILTQFTPTKVILTASGTPTSSAELSELAKEIPKITISAYSGGQLQKNTPSITLSIQGSIPVIGRLTENIPFPTIVSSGRIGKIGAVQGIIPGIRLSAYGGGQLRSATPSISLVSTGTAGGVGTLVGTIPKLRLVGQGRVGGDNRLIGTLPSISMGGVAILTGMTPRILLRSTATTVIAQVIEGYNVNLKNGSVTKHDYMPITKIVQWGEEYFGIGSGGVYKMEGTTVDGVPPTSEISISGIGDESEVLKKMPIIYFRYRQSGDVVVTVIPDEGDPRSYTLSAKVGDKLSTRRCKVARGIKGRSWEIKAVGPSLDIDEIRIPLKELKRRLG